MSTMDALIARGIALVHEGWCPACETSGTFGELISEAPEHSYHYHGGDTTTPPRLWCPNCGQGYRINNGQLLITVPCNGGLHPEDMRRQ